jgi:hypothetical protein
MKHINKIFLFFLLLSIGILSSCKKNYNNPNAATDDQVFSSAKGLTGVATSLQRIYSSSRAGLVYNNVTANGFVTNELVLMNPGNVAEFQLSSGGSSVDGTNSVLSNIWTNANKIIYDANKVIEGAKTLSDKSYASGLIAYSSIFKALAIGSLSSYWEKIPDGIGTNVGFIDRNQGFAKAIATIDEALSTISANSISSSFLANIPAGVDITNTLHALKARYSLFSGNYTNALTSANSVDLTKKSSFKYDALTLNPIFETATSTNNVFQPVDSTFGLPIGLRPSNTDKRVVFYTSINTLIQPRFRINGFAGTSTSEWPIYLPGEIMLIKAEAHARLNNLPQCIIELNNVLTKTTDAFGIGAIEPATTATTQSDLLTEIYRNRCIELYMSGHKLEDMRRFGRPNSERKRNLFPYPFRERDNNPNTPPDPPF